MKIKSRAELPKLLKYYNLPMIACEVGVCCGDNATDLLKRGLKHIYCIDNWAHIPNTTGDGNFPSEFHEESYALALKNLTPYEGKYSLLKGMSNVMHRFIEDNSLGLVFIDCGHDYKSVKEDIENYYPKLVKSGIIAFHDYFNVGYGVKKAVDEFCDFKGLKINIIPENKDINNMSVWIQI